MNAQTRASPAQTTISRRLRSIHIRPIRPEDWHRLQLFHKRLSDDTVRKRFHGAKRELSTPLAHRLTSLDGSNDAGVVATTGSRGRIVGVARYFRISPTCAEVAFVVEDAYQHHGLGRRLMKRLIQTARQNGITEFVADVLPGNTAALHLLREVGPTRSSLVKGELDVWVELIGTPSPAREGHGASDPSDCT